MDIWLQRWGGGFYLLNKILLSFAEGSKHEKICRLFGWLSNLIGVPAWVILLILQKNWMAMAVEAGSIPALILGVLRSGRKPEKKDFKDKVVKVIAYLTLALGVCYSLKINRGVTSLTQVLEIGEMVGLLVGSYMLAKQNRNGWLLYMLMNGSMGTLQAIAGQQILVAQQIVSFLFCVWGYIRARNNKIQKEW